MGRAIQKSDIKGEEVDYFEGARYVALNWSEEQGRGSPLWRLLPRRRCTRGSRPGLTGAGPQGAARGDQEQWQFPNVRLKKDEKQLLIATIIELATEAMFTNRFYGFEGKKFRQMDGGPIGQRGTRTLARLVMQVFDRKWGRLVEEAENLHPLSGRVKLQP